MVIFIHTCYVLSIFLPFSLFIFCLNGTKTKIYKKYFLAFNLSVFILNLITLIIAYNNYTYSLFNNFPIIKLIKNLLLIGELFIFLFLLNYPRRIPKTPPIDKYIIIYSFIYLITSVLSKTTNLIKNTQLDYINNIHMLFFFGATLFLTFRKIQILKGIQLKKYLISFLSSIFYTITVLAWIFHRAHLSEVELSKISIILPNFFIIGTVISLTKYRYLNLHYAISLAIKYIIIFAIYILPIIFIQKNIPIFFILLLFILNYFIIVFVVKNIPFSFRDSLSPLRSAVFKVSSNAYKYNLYKNLINFLNKTLSKNTNIKSIEFFVNKKNNLDNGIESIPKDIEKTLTSSIDKNITAVEKMIFTEKHMIIPLFYDYYLIGALKLRYKDNNHKFSKQDKELLSKISRPVTTAFINTLLLKDFHSRKNTLKTIVSLKTKDAKTTIKKQSEFISIASHDIKTPLSIALLKLEQARCNCKLPEESLSSLESTFNALISLRDLTIILFKIQKYENYKITLNKKVVNIFKEIYNFYKNNLSYISDKNKNLSLEYECSKNLLLNIDNVRFLEVIQNIVGNAVKFSSKIIINVNINKNQFTVMVIDNGINIPDNKKEAIFEKFKTYDRKLDGIGLGLYISKKIIDLFNGSITVKNSSFIRKNIKTGTTFIIKIPYEKVIMDTA